MAPRNPDFEPPGVIRKPLLPDAPGFDPARRPHLGPRPRNPQARLLLRRDLRSACNGLDGAVLIHQPPLVVLRQLGLSQEKQEQSYHDMS